MVDKELVKKNFSRWAYYYDRYAKVQNLCALRLIEKVKRDSFNRILDIGCGTGNFTKLLKERFPYARIKAVDISPEMVKIAKEKLKDKSIEFIITDAESVYFNTKFDLISSNASFQWLEDLENTLLRYRRLLDGNGIILFSTFGPLTFYELDESLKELVGKDTQITSRNFFKKSKIEKILRSLFRKVELEEEIYKENFDSLAELFKQIKYSGIRGSGVYKKNFWTQNIIDRLEKIYKNRYKDITATYQVFFCKGLR